MVQPVIEVTEEQKMVPYKVVRGENGDARVEIQGKKYTPRDFRHDPHQVEGSRRVYLGQKITEAVILVPAYFNDSRWQATKDAGKITGLDVKRIIKLAHRGALAYGLDKEERNHRRVRFRRRHFDVSILEVGDGVVEVEIDQWRHPPGRRQYRPTHRGLDDCRVQKRIRHRPFEGKMALQRLKEAAEKAKMDLSTLLETDINLPFITADSSGPKHLAMKLTRSRFEQMCEDIFQRSVGPCKQALQDASVTPDKIDEVAW